MTETFNIELFHGHLIFEYNGLRVLVDTGSPITFGRDKEFEFMGKHCSCQTEFSGKTISDIASMMGYDVDVLMGLDLITQFRMKTDYQKKEITFSTEEIPFESQCSIPITLENGVVCVNLDVEGQSVKLALDTGAWISYIDKKFTEGKPVSETKEDFSPLIGQFSTPIYSMQVSAANQTFPVNFGNLPSQMATMLKLMGIYGVIGFDLFNAFTVVFDFENQQLLLNK